MVHGIFNFTYWQDLIALLIFTQITIASVTIYLHRYQAHRSLILNKWVSHFFRAWLWLTTGMNTKAWTAIHRKHHAKCETIDDPHSPQILGIKKVLWQGAELYRKESINYETLEKYGQGTPDDWVEKFIYTPHSSLGIYLMLLTNLLFFGLPGITIWAIQMLWIPFFAAGIVNGIGHYFGYRNYECADAARNILPLGIFIGGEELHNNHHAFGSAAKFSSKWFEIDIGWMYIKLLSWFKLAKIKKMPPKLFLDKTKHKIDAETLKAIILNRLHILSHYSKSVILPVLKAEKKLIDKKSKNIFYLSRKLLITDLSLFNTFERQRLALLLKKRRTLRKVYFYRMKLQAIWNKTTLSQKELIEALQEWCRCAENSGIVKLKEFSLMLKSFVPQLSS